MAVNKVDLANGETLIDLTGDSATEAVVFEGATFHGSDGEAKAGTFTITEEITQQDSLIEQIKASLKGKTAGGGSEPVIEPLEVTENGTYTAPNGIHGYSPVTVNVSAIGGNSEEDVAALLGNTMTELNNSIVTSLKTRACQAATKLVAVNLPSVTSIGSYGFYQCTGMETVTFPKLTSVSTQTFYGCTKLRHADCGQLSNIPAQTFNACSSLTELILRKTSSICTLSNINGVSNSPIGTGAGYVYVPKAMVDTYKTANNWANYADKFRAIEDYPEICG